MYLPATFWHDSRTAIIETARKHQTPLQYHLRQHDYMSFQRELRAGANPFVLDECGRTPLDLALLQMEDLLVTALCTTFPIDVLMRNIHYHLRHPAKFTPNYTASYASMYEHHNSIRLDDCSDGSPGYGLALGTGAFKEYPRYVPRKFGFYQHNLLPKRAFQEKKDFLQEKNTSREIKLHNYSHEASNDYSRTTEEQGHANSNNGIHIERSKSKKPPHESQEMISKTYDLPYPNRNSFEKMFRNQLLLVVEDSLSRLNKAQIKSRMKLIESQLAGLARVITIMVTNSTLHHQAITFRSILSKKNSSENATNKQRKIYPFIFEYFSFPYLFFGVLQIIFETYFEGKNRQQFNLTNPVDGRRLINVVFQKRLKGHEILCFLKKLNNYSVLYITIMGIQHFKPSQHLAESLLYMAFCLDTPSLFDIICKSCNIFEGKTHFDWYTTLKILILHKKKLDVFLFPLLTQKLMNVKGNSHGDEYFPLPVAQDQSDTMLNTQSFFSKASKEFNDAFIDLFKEIFGVCALHHLNIIFQRWFHHHLYHHHHLIQGKQNIGFPSYTSKHN